MTQPHFLSEPPVVQLAGIIQEPYNLAIATARTCYSSKGIITREEVVKDEKAIALRDRIGGSTLAAGHLTTRSADGTPIAYETYGSGPVMVVVGGAFNDRNAGRELAQAAAAQGLTGVAYDRRGRGDSGDTEPYAVQREIEDLAAVIGAVGGGGAASERPAHAHGVSSGGALVLQALAAGAPLATASVIEPRLTEKP